MDVRTNRRGHGGRARDSMIDTGYTGVVLSRRCELHHQVVTIQVLQRLVNPITGESRPHYPPLGVITRKRYDVDPTAAKHDFFDLLRKAIALRSYHDHLHSIGRPPAEALSEADIPPDRLREPHSLPALCLDTIFEECARQARQKPTKTQFNDPRGQAQKLFERDLTQPGPSVRFNGFKLLFKRYELPESTLFLPRTIYRAREEWRLRVLCAHGPWSMAIPDRPGQSDPLETLDEAWRQLVIHLQLLQADPDQRMYTGESLLWTGVPGLTFNVMRRARGANGSVIVNFQLRYQYQTPQGANRRISLGFWNAQSLNDRELSRALRKGAAMAAYCEALGTRAPERMDVNAEIPKEYWPVQPIIRITADDVLFYTERLEANLTLRTRQRVTP